MACVGHRSAVCMLGECAMGMCCGHLAHVQGTGIVWFVISSLYVGMYSVTCGICHAFVVSCLQAHVYGMSCMCSITCPVHHVWHNRWGVSWVWAHMVSCMWGLMCAASYMWGIMRMVCQHYVCGKCVVLHIQCILMCSSCCTSHMQHHGCWVACAVSCVPQMWSISVQCLSVLWCKCFVRYGTQVSYVEVVCGTHLCYPTVQYSPVYCTTSTQVLSPLSVTGVVCILGVCSIQLFCFSYVQCTSVLSPGGCGGSGVCFASSVVCMSGWCLPSAVWVVCVVHEHVPLSATEVSPSQLPSSLLSMDVVRPGCSCLGMKCPVGVPASLAAVQQEPACSLADVFQGWKGFVCPPPHCTALLCQGRWWGNTPSAHLSRFLLQKDHGPEGAGAGKVDCSHAAGEMLRGQEHVQVWCGRSIAPGNKPSAFCPYGSTPAKT